MAIRPQLPSSSLRCLSSSSAAATACFMSSLVAIGHSIAALWLRVNSYHNANVGFAHRVAVSPGVRNG